MTLRTLFKWEHRRPNAWPLALTPLLVVVLARLLLEPVLHDNSPFLLMTIGVMAAALYGGLWTAILGALLGGVAGLAFLSLSLGRRPLIQPAHLVQVGLYLLVSVSTAVLIEALYRARRRAEEIAATQAELAEQLTHANHAKDTFLAMVSHELRTPLNAIYGWSCLLLTGSLDRTKARNALEVIQRNARLQEQLIADLLDISRIVSGKMRLHPQRIDPRRVLLQTLETLGPAANARRIDVTSRADFIGWMRANPERLQQVLWNLLSNAIKFTHEGGHVAVYVTGDPERVWIRVHDDGPGIDETLLPHVFDRFQQGTDSKGGLGLGLAITRQLVELHGGTIRAFNRSPGPGAAFEIVLPRGIAARAASEAHGHDEPLELASVGAAADREE